MTLPQVPPVTASVLVLTELAPLMVEESEPGVLIVDTNGVIRYANKSAEHIIGLPRDLFLGSIVERFIPDASQERHRGLRDTFLAGAGGPRMRWMGQEQDIRLRNAEGVLIRVRIGLTSLVGMGGRYTAVAIYPEPPGQDASGS